MGRNKGSWGLGEGKRKEGGRVKGGERTEIGEKGGKPERKTRAGRGAWKEGLASPGARGNERGMGARLERGEKWERGGGAGGLGAGWRGRGVSRLCFPSPSIGR